MILHSASGSVVSDGDEEFFYKIPEELMLKGVNVLGAGDTFASCFLYKLLSKEATEAMQTAEKELIMANASDYFKNRTNIITRGPKLLTDINNSIFNSGLKII